MTIRPCLPSFYYRSNRQQSVTLGNLLTVSTSNAYVDPGYRIPAFRDIPATMRCSIVKDGDGPGPFGAKGCGGGYEN
jgi:hypothetical protein